MKISTIKQPYATLIMHQYKRLVKYIPEYMQQEKY